MNSALFFLFINFQFHPSPRVIWLSFFVPCGSKVAISLDCPFMIAPSFLSNVDLLKLMIWVIFETICHLLHPLIGNIFFHIGTGADIRPQKRSCKITESKRHDGDSKDILEKSICHMVQKLELLREKQETWLNQNCTYRIIERPLPHFHFSSPKKKLN
jgi:hypothetical protein